MDKICEIIFCTVDSIINGKPARDDRGSLTAQQRVDVNVDFSYGIISTVSIMVQHRHLQWLILQVLIVNLHRPEGNWRQRAAEKRAYEMLLNWHCNSHNTSTVHYVFKWYYQCKPRVIYTHTQSFTSNLNHSEFHCGLRDLGQTSVLKVVFPNLTWKYM